MDIYVVTNGLTALGRRATSEPLTSLLPLVIDLCKDLDNIPENKTSWTFFANLSLDILRLLVQSQSSVRTYIEYVSHFQDYYSRAQKFVAELLDITKVERVLKGHQARTQIERLCTDLDALWQGVVLDLGLTVAYAMSNAELERAIREDETREQIVAGRLVELLQAGDATALGEVGIRLDGHEWTIRRVAGALIVLAYDESLSDVVVSSIVRPLLFLLQSLSPVAQAVREEPWRIQHRAIVNSAHEPLPKGSFGEVHTATYFGLRVAVKHFPTSFDEAQITEFRNEVAVWHQLEHEHILPLCGACDIVERPFVVTPFMPNGTLRTHLCNPQSACSLAEKLRLLFQVASGMAYLHSLNVVHGDLKSQNILLDADFNAVVSDFGLQQTRRTTVSAILIRPRDLGRGTHAFMAPEMLTNEPLADPSPATDVYAFGITMYEVLNNCQPIWVGQDGPLRIRAVEEHVLQGLRPARLNGIPDGIWNLIQQCWHQNPAQRLTFDEIRVALEPFKTGNQANFEEERRYPSPHVHQELRPEPIPVPEPIPAPRPIPVPESIPVPEPIPAPRPIPVLEQWRDKLARGTAIDCLDLVNRLDLTLEDGGNDDADFELTLSVAGSDSVDRGSLEAYYQRAFARIFHYASRLPELQVVLSAIATAQVPLTSAVISRLFDIDIDIVRKCVRCLDSVLDPGTNTTSSHAAIRSAKHKAVATYLLHGAAVDQPFHVSYRFHIVLAFKCLSLIVREEPKANICDIYDFHDSIPDFDTLVDRNISQALKYSVAHFASHFLHCLQPDTLTRTTWNQYQTVGLGDILGQLFSTHLLFWLECSSLSRQFPAVINSLGELSRIIADAPAAVVAAETKLLAQEAYSFAQEFESSIVKSAPQVYSAGLAFCSKGGLIYGKYVLQAQGQMTIPFVAATYRSLEQTTRAPTANPRALVFEGHTGVVTSMAVTPNGSYVVSGSNDGTVKVWDIATQRLVHTLNDHHGAVNTVAVAPDGSSISSGSADRTIKIWETETGQLGLTLNGHTKPVIALDYFPDGGALISRSEETFLKIWEYLEDDIAPIEVKNYTSRGNCAKFTPDGSLLVASTDQYRIHLLGSESFKKHGDLDGHDDEITALAVSADSRIVASASVDRTVKLWNIAERRMTFILRGHESAVLSVAISPNNSVVASASDDGVVKLWDVNAGTLLRSFQGDADPVTSIVFTTDSANVIVASERGAIKLWSADIDWDDQTDTLAEGHAAAVETVILSRDNKWILSGSDDRTIKVWDSVSGSLVQTLTAHSAAIQSLAVSNDSDSILSEDVNGQQLLWDLVDGKYLRSAQRPADFVPARRPEPNLPAWSPVADADGWIRFDKQLLHIPSALSDWTHKASTSVGSIVLFTRETPSYPIYIHPTTLNRPEDQRWLNDFLKYHRDLAAAGQATAAHLEE